MRTCLRCGTIFTCGVEVGQESCWCATLPAVIPLTGSRFANEGRVYQGCLCPDCLQLLIQQQQQD